MAMAYNLATQARLQAMKDITAELAKEGKTYINASLKAIQTLEDDIETLSQIYPVAKTAIKIKIFHWPTI